MLLKSISICLKRTTLLLNLLFCMQILMDALSSVHADLYDVRQEQNTNMDLQS